MHHDDQNGNYWIIGYDLRVSPAGVGPKTPGSQVSFDPLVWASAREMNPRVFCEAFGIGNIRDTANGLNLAASLPIHPAPSGYVVAAFDAPEEVIVLVSESFGLQRAIGADSHALSTGGFVRLGYDVADLWTQRTALYATEVFQPALGTDQLALNKWGLLSTIAIADQARFYAENRDPKSSRYYPVGVWARI